MFDHPFPNYRSFLTSFGVSEVFLLSATVVTKSGF